MNCPLCLGTVHVPFFQDKRDYYRCCDCQLVFVPAHQRLNPLEEKAVYDKHENSPDDVNYRRFLQRIFLPIAKNIAAHSHGLDFGCGPGPTLSIMFIEAGHTMNIYDPIYAPDSQCFEQQYDFISSSEVMEHCYRPGEELSQLWSCLKPDGLLGIMTKRVIDKNAFVHWHYKNDPTHVCFFSVETFQWLARLWQATLIIADKDVVIFKKT